MLNQPAHHVQAVLQLLVQAVLQLLVQAVHQPLFVLQSVAHVVDKKYIGIGPRNRPFTFLRDSDKVETVNIESY
jgi:hypothetical protein